MRLRAVDLDEVIQFGKEHGDALLRCRIRYGDDTVAVIFDDGTFGLIGLDKGFYGTVSLEVLSVQDAGRWIDDHLYRAEDMGLIDHDEVEKIRARREMDAQKLNEERERETLARLKAKYEG